MDNEEHHINQIGEKSVYAENVNQLNITQSNEKSYSTEDVIKSFNDASFDLRSYKNSFGEREIKIQRSETDKLFQWIINEIPENKSNIAVLVGSAGSGKSVILNNLLEKLTQEKIPVLGIKSDTINTNEIKRELNLIDDIDTLFKALDGTKSVFIIDQIDALSLSLSTDRSSLHTIRRLIDKITTYNNIRIVISSREFDLDYDPYLEYYKRKEIFRVTQLSIDDVKMVLSENDLQNNYSTDFLSFLSTPIHLEIFCKIADKKHHNEFLSLQELYEEYWDKFIINKPIEISLNKDKIIEFLEGLSLKMYDKQEIFISENFFNDDYPQEIKYLKSEQVISKNSSKIQFRHQSFFDFVYAKSFVKKGESLSEVIKHDHQGLFIRPKVRQVMAYLREIDQSIYFSELRSILTEDVFRLHIQHLVLGDLGQIESPNQNEKDLIKEIAETNELLFAIFVESVSTAEWFKFLTETIKIQDDLKDSDESFRNVILHLCSKLLNKETALVANFLANLPEFKSKGRFISRIVPWVDKENSGKLIQLFKDTNEEWIDHAYYMFLGKLIDTNPDFVIKELTYLLHNYESPIDPMNDCIPGGHDADMVYEDLYTKYPEKAVPFFIEVIKYIVGSHIWLHERHGAYKMDRSYYRFDEERTDYRNLHYKIYVYVLEHIGKLFDSDKAIAKQLIVKLLQSEYVTIVNIPIVFIIKYPDRFKEEAFNILSKENFLSNYCIYPQFISYNIEELLQASYTCFNKEEKSLINKLIINAIPKQEKTKEGAYNAKGVSQWGYTRYGLTRHRLLSLLPETALEKSTSLKKLHQEGIRKFGNIKREKPEGGHAMLLGTPHEADIYSKMALSQWKSLMKKYTKEEFRFEQPYSLTSIFRTFEKEVSKRPDFFINFIDEIISDPGIINIYVVYGLQGLKEAAYNPLKTRDLFLKVLNQRQGTLNNESLQYLVWLINYFIETKTINIDIIDFLSEISKNYPDKNDILNPEDPLHDGINSVRGAAADRIVRCYKFNEFEEQIFSTLEFLANKENQVNIVTRAAALHQMALLNHLDKNRNMQLFLDLNYDYNPKLLSIPLHNLHPLVYLIHVDFPKLHDFFERAIEVPESHKVMSHVLFFAYLQGYEGSKNLLDKVLETSMEAKRKVVQVAFEQLKDERFFEKSLEIIERYLDVDDEELSKEYEHGFLKLSAENFTKLVGFIDKYVQSKVGRYREYYFYQFLLKAVKFNPEKCLEWTYNFDTRKKPILTTRMLDREPVEVVLRAYNGLKEYKNKDDQKLEYAMDVFDKLLREPEYRGRALEVINKMKL